MSEYNRTLGGCVARKVIDGFTRQSCRFFIGEIRASRLKTTGER